MHPRKRQLLLVAGFCLAIVATFFFAYRAGRIAQHVRWQEVRWDAEPIRPWMSVPFVAHTHHTSEDVLFRAIHVKPDPHDHRPIRDIARAEKQPVRELMRALDAALADPNKSRKAP